MSLAGVDNEIAAQKDALGDARDLFAVDALGHDQLGTIRFRRLAVAREGIGSQQPGERSLRATGLARHDPQGIGSRRQLLGAGRERQRVAALAEAQHRARDCPILGGNKHQLTGARGKTRPLQPIGCAAPAGGAESDGRSSALTA